MANPYIEGDDEVVAEYDVFLSTGLAGDVHVFQFPLRPYSRPYEASSIELFVTDGIGELKKQGLVGPVGANGAGNGNGGGASNGAAAGMGMGLGTNNINNNNGANANGGAGGSSSSSGGVNPSPTSRFHMKCTLDTFGSDCFLGQVQRNEENRHSYEYALGSAPFTSRSSYAVGLLRDDALHLCPVNSIQQFTPKVRSAVKDRFAVPPSDNPHEAVGPLHSSTIDAAGAAAAASSITTGNNLRARDRDMVRQTRSFMLNADAKTSQPLVFYPMDSSESGAKRNLLVCSTITPSMPKVGAPTATSTTDAFFPQDQLLDVSADVAKKLVLRPGGTARKQDHVADLVHSAQVITVAEVIEAMTLCGFPNMTEAELVPMLREHAYYIHGVWVSRLPGVKISFPQLREIILLQFAASPTGTVRRADLNSLITRREPALLANILNILNTIAVISESPNPEERVWRLKKSATKEEIAAFAAAYPQDFQFQQETWVRRKPMINEILNAVNDGREMRAAGANAPNPAAAAVPRPVAAAGPNAVSAANAINAAGGAAAVAGAGATSQADVWVNQIRAFVRQLFAEHGVVAKSLTRNMIMARSRDPRCPFYNATPDVLGNACRMELESFTDSTFILIRVNAPDVDAFRKYIVAAAKEKQQFAAADVVDRAQRLIESDFAARGAAVPAEMQNIPKPISARIISEIAVHKTAEKLWHLKTGFIDVQQ